MWATRFLVVTGMILAAAASRLLPHPPNLAPIAAVALFGGVYIRDRWLALFVPLTAMLLSDLVLGGHEQIVLVYSCLAATVGMGIWLRQRPNVPVELVAVASSLLFFIVTNFGVWASGQMIQVYPHTGAGLVQCYVVALPFYQNTLLGDLCYMAALFGGFALLETCFSRLRRTTLTPAAASC